MNFLLLWALLAGLAVATNKDVCRKFGAVNQALNGICANTKLVVPSNAAMQGATSSNGNAFVQIVGTCSPPQWVPQNYCFSQFGDMCYRKVTVRKYGRNNCQTWKINVPHSGSGNGLGGKAGT